MNLYTVKMGGIALAKVLANDEQHAIAIVRAELELTASTDDNDAISWLI